MQMALLSSSTWGTFACFIIIGIILNTSLSNAQVNTVSGSVRDPEPEVRTIESVQINDQNQHGTCSNGFVILKRENSAANAGNKMHGTMIDDRAMDVGTTTLVSESQPSSSNPASDTNVVPKQNRFGDSKSVRWHRQLHTNMNLKPVRKEHLDLRKKPISETGTVIPLTVFVYGLQSGVTQAELRYVFESNNVAPTKIDIRVSHSGLGLYAFVEFQNQMICDTALRLDRIIKLADRTMRIQPAYRPSTRPLKSTGGFVEDKHDLQEHLIPRENQIYETGAQIPLTVYVRGLVPNVKQAEIRGLFEAKGLFPTKVDIRVPQSGHGVYAFVKFQSQTACDSALQLDQVIKLHDKTLSIFPAIQLSKSVGEIVEVEQDLQEHLIPRKKKITETGREMPLSVYVRGFPSSVTQDDIWAIFNANKVYPIKVRILVPQSGRKLFALVDFRTHTARNFALQLNKVIKFGDLTLTVERAYRPAKSPGDLVEVDSRESLSLRKKPMSETGTELPLTVYVSGFHSRVIQADIRRVFEDNGLFPTKVDIYVPRTSSRTYALVEFDGPNARNSALQLHQGIQVNGKLLNIQRAYAPGMRSSKTIDDEVQHDIPEHDPADAAAFDE